VCVCVCVCGVCLSTTECENEQRNNKEI